MGGAVVQETRYTADRERLRPDCARCFGLCCAALGFVASSEFAIDKAAGVACPNLQADFRCGIHAELRERGFAGCVSYDCFGAGQQVSQVTFGGQRWQEAPGTAAQMFAVLPIMRGLHELLWYASEALTFPAAEGLRAELRSVCERLERLTQENADTLLGPDVAVECRAAEGVLRRASELARAAVPGRRRDRHGADLIGAKLRDADLRAANLSRARLIGADLRGADLRSADLMGTDLRGADLRRTDLRGAIFLTQSQVDSARGDGATRLPGVVRRPAHWQEFGEPKNAEAGAE